MEKLRILICLLAILTFVSASAQQTDFQWRVGLSAGYSNYLGDLTPKRIQGTNSQSYLYHIFNYNENYAIKPSFKATLEKQLSNSAGIALHFGQYYFGMSDRYVDRKGNLYLDNPNFSRSLNFSNRTKELGLSLVLRADNDRLLSSKAWLAPFVSIGVGILHFDVWGDLLDQNGEKYNNSIIGKIHDGHYETHLPQWETELDGGYGQVSFTSKLGLGFRLKLTKRLEAFAQSDFILTFTDFLDDVSGRYRDEYSSSFQEYAAKPGFNIVDPEHPFRGNPNGLPDKIFYHGIGLKYNLGASKKNFNGPRISAGFMADNSAEPQRQVEMGPDLKPASDQRTNRESSQGSNTYIMWQQIQKLDTIKYQNQLLAWDQEIQRRENLTTAGKLKERNLVQIQDQIEKQYLILLDDSNIPAEEKEKLLRATDKNRFDVRYSLDSLRRKERELTNEIDSIARLRRDHKLVPTVMVIHEESNTMGQSEQIGYTETRGENESISKSAPVEEQGKIETNQAAPREAVDQNQTALTSTEREKLQNLEIENKYLQSERDRLLSESINNKSQSNQKREKRPKTRTKNRNDRVVVRRESGQPKETRRQRRERLAATTAVLGAAVLLSQDKDGDKDTPNDLQGNAADAPVTNHATSLAPDQSTNVTPMDISEEQIEALSLALAGMSRGATMQVPPSKSAPSKSAEIVPRPISQMPDTLPEVNIPGPAIEKIDNPKERMALPDTSDDRRPRLPENYFKPFENVYFGTNQRIPTKTETEKLQDLADFVRSGDGYGLLLTGYTDNTGSLNYNLRLAEERMANVGKILENDYGIPANLLFYESGGKVVRGNSSVDNASDRRVEVKLVRLDMLENRHK